MQLNSLWTPVMRTELRTAGRRGYDYLHLVGEHLHITDINFNGKNVFFLFEKEVQ